MKEKLVCIVVYAIIILLVLPVTSMPIYQSLKSLNEQPTLEGEWWPMLGHDPQHTGCSTSEAPDSNMVDWTYDTGSAIRFSSPVVVDDKLYIGTGEIGSKHLATPHELRTQSVLEWIGHSTLVGGRGTGGMFCIDVTTGEKLWDVTTHGEVLSIPVVSQGYVYVLTCDAETFQGDLYCIDALTGEIEWQSTYFNLITTPTIDENKLFVLIGDPSDGEGKLLCLDPTDGSELWNHSTGVNNLAMYSAPAVYDGMVYFVSIKNTDVNLYCVDADTGEDEWSTFLNIIEMGVGITTPVVYNDHIYVNSLESYYSNQSVRNILFCFDADDGDEVWRYRMNENDLSFSIPAVYNDAIYFTYAENYWSYAGLACADAATGDILWDERIYSDFFTVSQPAIADEKLYLCSMNQFEYAGMLNCYDVLSGETLWTYPLDEMYMTDVSPAVADGNVYAASPFGLIYSFEDKLKIAEISGGLASVKVGIENTDTSDFTDVDWSITVTGGLLGRINVSNQETLETLAAQSIETIRAFPVFGFGAVNITVSVSMEGINTITQTKPGLVFGIFVIVT